MGAEDRKLDEMSPDYSSGNGGDDDREPGKRFQPLLIMVLK